MVKIGDFGIAQITDHTAQSLKTQNAMGFPSYQAVELFKGGRYTSSVDIWALGCILFEMLHYERFFVDDIKERVMPMVRIIKLTQKVLDNDHQPIKESHPPKIRDIIMKCVNPDPLRRPLILELLEDSIEFQVSLCHKNEKTIAIPDLKQMRSGLHFKLYLIKSTVRLRRLRLVRLLFWKMNGPMLKKIRA